MAPIAATVATLDPHTSANIAHATMPASPRPPCQWPTSEVAKLIIRRATPPWVRKLPARMKNGIAMISKLSMPVNSFIDTASIGTADRENQDWRQDQDDPERANLARQRARRAPRRLRMQRGRDIPFHALDM